MRYLEIAFRFFGKMSETFIEYFPDVRDHLKKARIKYSYQEYFSLALFTSFLTFLMSLPILSLLLSFKFPIFLFSFLFSITLSMFLAALTFFLFINYPLLVAKSISKRLDTDLPFATLYLSSISSSKLPLHKVLEMFEKFGGKSSVAEEIRRINLDIKSFGLDVNTAIERAIDRIPSKNMQELLWGILSVSQAGGEVDIFLKEKSATFFEEYRRKLYEFAHSLTIYLEVYLTAVIVGTIFFTVLTSLIAGIAGVSQSIVPLQFLMIAVVIPLISMLFAFIIRSIAPGGD